MRDNGPMSNPSDPDGVRSSSDQGSSDQGNDDQRGYGQNPGGYGQSPSGYGSQNPSGPEQNPRGYGQNPPGYDQRQAGYDQSPGGYDQGSGGYTPAPYGQGYSASAGDHPQGTTILFLGIVGIFFTICAPIAWYLGSRALKEIKASGATYNNQQQIVIGRTLGIIFTILAIIGLVIGIFFVIIAVVAASQGAR